jgi:hypothetical protein
MIVDKPVPGVQTVARTHPSGGEGARISLEEVAKRAFKARMSPRLRAWVTQELAKCNASAGSRRQKASCILEAFRKKVPYIADPHLGEFMATPEQTLCLDEGGLCIVGGDCDDAAVTLAAAVMSIGIPAMIIGSSHREPHHVPSHVCIAFEDDHGKWVRMDGTTKHPIGQAPPRVREFWVEPGKDAKASGEGDFVGMAGAGLLADLLIR